MRKQAERSDWRGVHGILFVALLVMASASPELRRWPWVWVAPLLVYYLLVMSIPPLRRSFSRRHIGRISAAGLAATLAISVISCLALAVFHIKVNPDVRALGAALPVQAMGGVALAGVCFALANASLEEIAFRGILFDAIESHSGPWISLLVTGTFFGWGHLHGYPPGLLGAFLAGVYGMGLAWLRIQSGGLGLPIAAHVVADATIYVLLVKSGAV